MEKINLSTSTNITTTYAGEFAGKYIAAAILSAPTLEQGGLTIHPNVKYKQITIINFLHLRIFIY